MIEYPSLEQVLEIHKTMIEKFGGLSGIRDKNLLLSALEAPKASFGGFDLYPSIFEKAATYLASAHKCEVKTPKRGPLPHIHGQMIILSLGEW